MSPERDLALFLAGIARFNAGEFYEAHEAWEDLWLRNRSDARPFYQGLIQAAAGFHHLGRGKPRPAARLFAEAAGRLSPFAPAFLGVEVAPLLVVLRGASAHAEEQGRREVLAQPLAALPMIAWVAPAPEAFSPHRGSVPRPAIRRRGP